MMTCHYYFTRRQIVIVWEEQGNHQSKCYPRTERGWERANNHLKQLLASGYTQAEAPQDWFANLLSAAQKARES